MTRKKQTTISTSGFAFTDTVVLPVLPLPDTIIYPGMVSPIFLEDEAMLPLIEATYQTHETLLVVAQRNPDDFDGTTEALYEVGCEITIARLLKMPDGSTSILTRGEARCLVSRWRPRKEMLRAQVQIVEELWEPQPNDEALMRSARTLFERCLMLNDHLTDEMLISVLNADEPGWLADLIASFLELALPVQQAVLETFDPIQRLQMVVQQVAQELELLELEEKIHLQVQNEVDRSQREYFLREQLRVIQEELGDGDPLLDEMAELHRKIEAAGMSEVAQQRAARELRRLEAIPPISPEAGPLRTYIETMLELPWNKRSEDQLDLHHAASVLNENHFGLPKIKDRILEHIAVRQLSPKEGSITILCFVGPPGTGKTSLGKSIAQALGREFVRVSLGGTRDEAEIRGHRRTYIGAMPGRILQGMSRAGTINPVFMLDEIDKLGFDFRGDPAAALLEALDPEQNREFSDHYLELPYNLSEVFFITTANMLYTIPEALLDRMEIIEFMGYTEEEKLSIAQQFLIPRQLARHGLESDSLTLSNGALKRLIREYTGEAGVRNLEREIATLCRKVARTVAEGNQSHSTISQASVQKLLGPPPFSYGLAAEEDEVGMATGVAVSEAGGDLMVVEVITMEGRGAITLTGQLGEVLQESAQAALSYARANAIPLGIQSFDWDKVDIHIHLPEGAIPKDGPSAGITMATALISALTQRPVRRDVAMTGEITLRGRVLPIGGFKDKVLAAHRAGIKTFVAPKKNKKDVVEIPSKVRRDMTIHFVERMDEVVALALLDPVAKPRHATARRIWRRPPQRRPHRRRPPRPAAGRRPPAMPPTTP